MAEIVYLACPYSHPARAVRLARFEAANQATANLLRRGLLVFSPISYSHALCEQCGIPWDDPLWYPLGEAMLRACHRVFVLMLEGWEESQGVKAELAIARELGLAVEMMEACR